MTTATSSNNDADDAHYDVNDVRIPCQRHHRTHAKGDGQNSRKNPPGSHIQSLHGYSPFLTAREKSR